MVSLDAQPGGVNASENRSGFPNDDRAPKRSRLRPLVGTVPAVGAAEPDSVPSSAQDLVVDSSYIRRVPQLLLNEEVGQKSLLVKS